MSQDSLQDKNSLERFADAVEKLAFEMPAPNPYTPRFVQLAVQARSLAFSSLASKEPGYLDDILALLRRKGYTWNADNMEHAYSIYLAEARASATTPAAMEMPLSHRRHDDPPQEIRTHQRSADVSSASAHKKLSRADISWAINRLGLGDAFENRTPYGSPSEMVQHIYESACEHALDMGKQNV